LTRHSPAASRTTVWGIRGQTKYENRANRGIWLTGEWSCLACLSLEYLVPANLGYVADASSSAGGVELFATLPEVKCQRRLPFRDVDVATYRHCTRVDPRHRRWRDQDQQPGGSGRSGIVREPRTARG
jgi:hypothetical protein